MGKKDFLDELSKEVDAKKSGRIDHISNIDQFKSSHHRVVKDDLDETIEQVTRQAQKDIEIEQTISNSIPQEEVSMPNEPVTVENMYEDPSGRPGSFTEEHFVPVTKPKKKMSKGAIIGLILVAAAVVAFVVWSLMPHITMPQFVGKTLSDVSTWARQNQIESTAIGKGESVYSMEYAADVIIEQSVPEGKKIKKDTPITFTVSAGPDPEEHIDFPDIKNMTQSEISSWVSENKLSKTKVTTEYSTTVESGNVISYELKNTDESDFRRNSTLNIRVSKGAAPVGQVTVTDFTGKTVLDAQTWANTNKLVFEKVETFSESVDTGIIISQSVKVGDALTQGDKFTVTVSKGKGVKIPNLVGYTKEQLDAWKTQNSSVAVIATEIYNDAAPGSVIAQNTPAGSIIGTGDVVEITVSLYLPIIEETSREWLGKDWMLLKAKVDEFNWKGADIQAGQYAEFQYSECSDTYPTPGQIIDYACWYGNTDEDQGCGRPLNLNSRIAYKVSTGACTVVKKDTPVLSNENLQSLTSIQTWCNENQMACSYEPFTAASTDPNVWLTVDDKYFNTNTPFQELINPGTSISVHYAQKTAPAEETKKDVVLTKENLSSLSAIQSWCSNNGMQCNYQSVTKADIGDQAVQISVADGPTYHSDDLFSDMINQGKAITVKYATDYYEAPADGGASDTKTVD